MEREALRPDWVLTVEELKAYAEHCGKSAAASLLLLTPPDCFTGDYEATLAELCGNS